MYVPALRSLALPCGLCEAAVNFGLTFDKLIIIGVIALFVIGPERLPHYAAMLGRFVKSAKSMVSGAKERVRDELGPDFDEVDWKKLDPRQYDPRRIIREALADDEPPPRPKTPAPADVAPNTEKVD